MHGPGLRQVAGSGDGSPQLSPPTGVVSGRRQVANRALYPGAPPYVMVTAAIVANYLAAAGTRSLRSVARAAGIDATSLGLHGLPGDSQKCDW